MEARDQLEGYSSSVMRNGWSLAVLTAEVETQKHICALEVTSQPLVINCWRKIVVSQRDSRGTPR